jgi:hypothetical protein
MRVVVQKAVIEVIKPQIVEYYCDTCGAECGTKANPKETWSGGGKRKHYCKKTCSRRRRDG